METNSAPTMIAQTGSSTRVHLSAFVLTRNEELNLEDCLRSLAGWCQDIHLVDSFSTDRTLEIAERYGAIIHQHKFEGHTKQRLWALRNLPFKNEWVLALDADHRVTEDLQKELAQRFASPPEGFEGLFVNRRQIFRGRWIRFGGYYPKHQLKIFKHQCAYLDDLEFDYRFYVKGKTGILKYDILEANQNEWKISWFIEKHNKFATELATEEIKRERENLQYLTRVRFWGNPDQRILWLKKVWGRLPAYVRPFLLFTYRYFLCLGFLDGKEGFVFHFLQSLWFRLLVDIRREELEAEADSLHATQRQSSPQVAGRN
ncbi:MAG TPA: glycosyltransferase family 2 protein [Bryobacteraceae bacterium]|jgi:glycosyltransferase involved in cell wall biosynthesis|nr:glycosyltransferase family 2 protein [Bryobacteraceae bacterium]